MAGDGMMVRRNDNQKKESVTFVFEVFGLVIECIR